MTRRQSGLDRLYLSEGEIADRVGLTTLEWQAAAAVLARDGLPRPDPLFGGRRHWPAVKAFLDRRAGLGQSSVPVTDGSENWDEKRRAQRARTEGPATRKRSG